MVAWRAVGAGMVWLPACPRGLGGYAKIRCASQNYRLRVVYPSGAIAKHRAHLELMYIDKKVQAGKLRLICSAIGKGLVTADLIWKR